MLSDVKLIASSDMKELGEIVQKDGAGQAIRSIYGYILAAGSVRQDVYEFLLSHTEYELYSIQFINDLIKYFAGPEWFELISEAEKKSEKGEKICRLYQQSIVYAFRESLNADEVKRVLEGAGYPYELDLWIANKMENKKTESGSINMALAETLKTFDAVTDRIAGICNKHERILFELLELAEGHNKILSEVLEHSERKQIGEVKTEAALNVADTDTEMVEKAVPDENDVEVMVTGGIEEQVTEVLIQESQAMPKQKKVNLDTAGSIGHFFQRIRNKKHKSEFLKLDDNKKIEELFILMRQKNYDRELVSAVRKCIERGVSSEFLYVFIEAGAEWEDFENLITFITKTKEEQ